MAVSKKKTGGTVGGIDYGGLCTELAAMRSSKFASLKDGKNYIRPLPSFCEEEGRHKLFHRESSHFDAHPDHKVLPCLPGCPICRFAEGLEDKDAKKALRRTDRFAVLAVDRADGEVKVYRLPFGVFSAITDVVRNTDDYPDSLSLDNGFDYLITKTGSGLGTNYAVSVLPKRCPAKVDASKIGDITTACGEPKVDLAFIQSLMPEIHAAHGTVQKKGGRR